MTQTQFEAAQDNLDAQVRATKRGTPERAAIEAKVQKWEAAQALPQATSAQRTARRQAVAAVAVELGLVQS